MAKEGRDAVEAPIDGWMLSKKGGDNQAAKDLLAFMGTAEGSNTYQAIDPSNLSLVKDADTSKLTPLNKKCSDVIAGAKNISQFLDRDALPAMANNVMIPALQNFIKTGDIDTGNLEKQAAALYAGQ
jgi:multiple sugar transport system substrate-binding protein